MITLEVLKRDSSESPETLRKKGIVPAVFYGPKEDTTPIAIDSLKLERLWREAGETTIVRVTGVGEEKDTLIHDVQFHPVTGKLQHADFYVIEKGKKVTLKVPLEFTGQAPAEKAGHIIVKTLHEVEIEVTPQDLPHSLPVDLSSLENVGDHITVARIPLPGSASFVTSSEEIVVSVKEFKEEAPEITPAPETIIEGAVEAKTEEGAAAGSVGEKSGKSGPTPGAKKEERK